VCGNFRSKERQPAVAKSAAMTMRVRFMAQRVSPGKKPAKLGNYQFTHYRSALICCQAAISHQTIN
jgi:hypothetical protein